MKRFSVPAAPRGIDRPTAWACTVTNLATLPGLGSLAAGRRVGYAQATVALAGFGLSLLWLGLFVRDWLVEGSLPLEWRPSLWFGLSGISLFAVGWLWALTTSLSLLRAARHTGRPASTPADTNSSASALIKPTGTDDPSRPTPPRL